MSTQRLAAIAVSLLTAAFLPVAAQAADLKAQVSGALKLAFPDMVAAYEKASGNKVSVTYAPSGAVAKAIEDGAVADLVIAPNDLIEKLAARGKVLAGSTTGLARITIGIAIRKGAPKPDIATVDALKKTLLAAKAIGYRDPKTGSNSGTYTAQMIERLGLTAVLKSKTVLDNSDGEHPELVFQALERGETELQFGAITEIIMAHGIELLGPLPDAVQKVTLLKASIPATSESPDAAKELIEFLTGPAATTILKANGFAQRDNMMTSLGLQPLTTTNWLTIIQIVLVSVGFVFSWLSLRSASKSIAIATGSLAAGNTNLGTASQNLRLAADNAQAQLMNQFVIQGRELQFKSLDLQYDLTKGDGRSQYAEAFKGTVLSYYSACFELRGLLRPASIVESLLDNELASLLKNDQAYLKKWNDIKDRYSQGFRTHVETLLRRAS